MKINTNEKYRDIVLRRVEDLKNSLWVGDGFETMNEVENERARLAEALTFAMQLDLMKPFDATETGVLVDFKIIERFKNLPYKNPAIGG